MTLLYPNMYYKELCYNRTALFIIMYAMSLCFGLKQNVTYIIEHNSQGLHCFVGRSWSKQAFM